MEIYLIENGKKVGPFSVWQLREKVEGGAVTPETLGWQPGMAEWAPVREIGPVRIELDRLEKAAPEPADRAIPETEEREAPETERTDAAREAGMPANPREGTKLVLPQPKPWRRFWARMIDMGILNLSAIVIGLATGSLTKLEAYQPPLGFILTLPVAWIFLESSLLMIVGTTPGKFLLGVRVGSIAGHRLLSLRQALGRSFMVWWRGYGLGLTIPMVLTCTFSHFVLKTTRTTPWDAAYGVEVSYGAIKPWRIAVLGLLFLGLFQLLYALAGMPPKIF